MSHKLAIDFGTTNSVIACWSDQSGTAEFIAIPGLSANPQDGCQPLIPSLLYVQDGRSGQVIIGQAVLDDKLDRQGDGRLFRNFKRGIVAGSAMESRIIDGVPWTDHDAGRHFLRGLTDAIVYPAEHIEQLVVTVPVAAFEGYVAWLSEVMQGFSPETVRIVDESTAAALGYAVTEPEAVVLVFDFGGGSLDLSLVQLPESCEKTGGLLQRLLGSNARQNAASVIAKAGLSLGGSDIDQWMLAEVLRRIGLSTHDLGKGYAALLTSCEQAKIALSTLEATTVTFEGGGRFHTVPFRRVELETLLEENGFYTALRRIVDKVMCVAQRCGIFREDINHVLMVGGTSLMPSVQRTLKHHFRDIAVRVDKRFTAVAEGALQIAAGFGLDDRLAHSYGLRYLDLETGEHQYDEIIPMGSRYPTAKPVQVLLGAAHPNQEAIEFLIGQIDTDAVSMLEVKYEERQVVFVAQAEHGTQKVVPLNRPVDAPTLAHLVPPGTPSEDRLQAQFAVDEQRRLRLTVVDLKTGEELFHDAAVVTLGESKLDAPDETQVTKYAPCLSSPRSRPGQYRLSLRGLATMLKLLPPEAISLEATIEALRSTDFYVRYSAAEMLSRRSDRDARLIMRDVLTNGSPPMRASVAHHLHRFSWFVAEPLLRQALKDPDQRVHVSAIYALCKMRGSNAYQLMTEVLPNEDDNVRLAAAWGLGCSPDAGAVPVLEIALQAQDPKVREKVLESLGATEAPEAMPVVRRAMDDPDLEVKYAATLSLVELAGETCFPELASIIERTCGVVRYRILRGLFHATNYLQIDIAQSTAADRVIDALEAALLDNMSEVRVAAAMPLAWMRHDRAATILREGYYREQDSKVKARMLHIAVSLTSAAGEALLQDALHSQDTHVRQVAEQIAYNCSTAGSGACLPGRLRSNCCEGNAALPQGYSTAVRCDLKPWR